MEHALQKEREDAKIEEQKDILLARRATFQMAYDIHVLKNWISFIGVLIVIALFLQLFGSCLG